MMGAGGRKSSLIVPAAAILGAWLCGAGHGHAEDALQSWRAALPDAELAAASGQGVVVSGEGNAAALAKGTATVTGNAIGESITAGSIRDLDLQQISGVNVFQVNTGQNVSQLVNQALVVEIIDPSGPQR
jgi:hypothetical protein